MWVQGRASQRTSPEGRPARAGNRARNAAPEVTLRKDRRGSADRSLPERGPRDNNRREGSAGANALPAAVARTTKTEREGESPKDGGADRETEGKNSRA